MAVVVVLVLAPPLEVWRQCRFHHPWKFGSVKYYHPWKLGGDDADNDLGSGTTVGGRLGGAGHALL